MTDRDERERRANSAANTPKVETPSQAARRMAIERKAIGLQPKTIRATKI
jgi:hypothetical protein